MNRPYNFTVHGYGSYTAGCRCDVCKGAKAQRERENRAARADKATYGTPILTFPPAVDDLSWQDDAACLGVDAELFFSPEGERGERKAVREAAAKAVCAGCPVRARCGEQVRIQRPEYGMWAGLDADEWAAVFAGRTAVAA